MDGKTLSGEQSAWLVHIEACRSAGVSMKAYAEQHGLDLQSFYLWNGRLKKLGVVNAKPGCQLVEAVRVLPPVDRKTCIQLANGVSIECSGDFDAALMAALLELAIRL